MPSRVRISDVASAAGVSIATVSAALNDVESARISAGTQQRVREAAASLGYVPNRLAQGLRAQRSRTIGFMLPIMPCAAAAQAVGRAARMQVLPTVSTMPCSQISRGRTWWTRNGLTRLRPMTGVLSSP